MPEDSQPIAPRRRHIGPLSRASTLAKLDRRTKEARHVAAVIADLTKHIGNPSATEALLIQRCAWLSLRVALFDEQIAAGGDLSAHAFNAYTAWSNALVRALARLGLKGVEAKPPSLADIAREINSGKDAAGPPS